MIPDNITKESVLKAIDKINLEGVPKGRESTKYNIRYMGKLYPPKYTISLANIFVNGNELKAQDFSGGQETNNFLKKLGFVIDNYSDSYKKDDSQDEGKIEKEECINIATVTIQSPQLRQPSNKDRLSLLENVIMQAGKYADVILFPAGFYKEKRKPNYLYSEIEDSIKECLIREGLDITVCLGVDGRDGKDQIGLAINRQGIISIGRKFYPTDEEKNSIDVAKNYLSTENGYSRIFEIKGKKLYIAICYDGFGIRKQNLANPQVDGILNLVHGFYPNGCGGSGEVYFAKYSFAGSSKQWKCPTFGTTTFFDRNIPDKWPTGVFWNQKDKSVQEWKYKDNIINASQQIEVSSKKEKAVIRVYSFNNSSFKIK